MNKLESISEEIGNLNNLTRLWLHKNQLTKLPESIGNLTNLTSLNLSSNELTKLPKSIGNLTNLPVIGFNQGLYMEHNPFTSFPDSIRKVKHAISQLNQNEYKLLFAAVEDRVSRRVQRRLVIITAQVPPPPPPTTTTQAVTTGENTRLSPVHKVLLSPKLARRIAEYVDYK